jgi:hypothetical protein
MKDFKTEFNYWNMRFYHISIVLLLASIPLSKYTTSLSQFLMLGFWLLHRSDITYLNEYLSGKKIHPLRILSFISGFFRSIILSLIEKFSLFFRNKAALIITSLLLLHVLGLFYTTDFGYAMKDLRTKLPLLLMPLFFSTGPALDKRAIYWIFLGYIAALFGGTIYRLILFIQLPVADPRAMNPHISHIRFSLNAVFAIFILLYYAHLKDSFLKWKRVLFIIMAFWLLLVMFYLKYTTGIAIFMIITFLIAVNFALKASRLTTKLLLIAGGISLLIIPSLYFLKIAKEFRSTEAVDFHTLELYTSNGNSYYHDTVNFKVENGSYTGLYICDKELRKSWLERSSVSIDSLDSKQQYIRYTLIRYLASKQLRKDSAGIAQLSHQDIRNIEAGLTSSKSRQWFHIRPQIENLLTGWDNYRYHNNPNSSSLIQRVEYWRSSIQIIKQNPIFGVGTGDVPEAFRTYYSRANSMLDPQFRLRSHNQFLSITVAFGVVGLIWFLFVLLYPVIKLRTYHPYFYLIFWTIFFISIFTEDTLETQEGVTFYAFFTSLLLFGWSNKDDKETGQSQS